MSNLGFLPRAASLPWRRVALLDPISARSLARTGSWALNQPHIRPRTTSRAFSASSRLGSGGNGGIFGGLPLFNRRLDRIETEANAAPHDPDKQAELYRELLRTQADPNQIISRFEQRGTFAANDECAKCYIVALARAGQGSKILPKLRNYLATAPVAAGPIGIPNGGSSSPPLYSRSPTPSLNANELYAMAAQQTSLAGQPPPAGTSGQSSVSSQGQAAAAAANAPLGMLGASAEHPLHISMPDKNEFSLKKAAFSFLKTAAWAFFLLTGVSLFLENQGIYKMSGSQQEVDAQSKPTVQFADVAGVDEAKQELEEIVEFLKDPEKFTCLGGKMPRGVLLTGPPGTGKTMLARAVAGEAGVPFFFMSGSEFDELYVGVGARRVRDLFAAARRKAPSIIFIDELDAIGGKRNPKDQSYMRQTLNQLLVELDGFSQAEGVIIMAATNFPELLDKALVRPGRFDKHVNVPLPDVRGRMHILSVHIKAINADPALDVSVIARGTPGFSGAELANLVNQAAIQASREESASVQHRHFEFAKDKILMGAERKSAVVSESSRRITAFHEGGHALVAMYTAGAMPLHKATIMPRGASLGMTVQLPEMDKDNYSKKEYLAMIDVAMGGRAAEELIYGEENVTSGAHNDMERATSIARKLVTQLGMSEKVGLVALPDDEFHMLSNGTKQLVEQETRLLVEQAYVRAKNLLRARRAELDRLAHALIEYETLTQDEIDRAVRGKSVR